MIFIGSSAQRADLLAHKNGHGRFRLAPWGGLHDFGQDLVLLLQLPSQGSDFAVLGFFLTFAALAARREGPVNSPEFR
jgi:hypothetical protein